MTAYWMLTAGLSQIENNTPFKQNTVGMINNDIVKPSKDKIALHTTEGVHIVKIKNIIRCSAENYYTVFHIKGGSKITVSKTLKEYCTRLESQNFFRTHRSHLINLEYVERYVFAEGGYIIMENGDFVQVSRSRKKMFLDTIIN